MRAVLVVPFLLAAAVAAPASDGEEQCDPAKCKGSQNCMCASIKPPNGIEAKDMPQLVMLAFEGAVNTVNMPFYRELMDTTDRKNKQSGCRIGTTFFVNHEYLDYSAVHELHNRGSEIALRSITLNGTMAYWTDLDTDGWKAEIIGERDLLATQAIIPASDIYGMQAPLLTTGGDNSFKMIKDAGLLYDASIPHNRVKDSGRIMFPYTLDYGLQTPCVIEPCPEDKYPGVWTIPLNVWFKENQIEHLKMDFPCSTIDSCTPPPASADEAYEFLMANFKEFYENNKAPFPMILHEGWLREGDRKAGFLRFIDWLLAKDDVFLVTVKEVIEFMKNPKPAKSYKESRCVTEVKPSDKCKEPETCIYPRVKIGYNIGDRVMRSCVNCTQEYPWVRATEPVPAPDSPLVHFSQH
uniref:Putative peritrophic membrane chitin binding protein n=1 Tax=Ixodes scapularis TaxID=6945 RepID=A0A4D5RKZ7_IXOSC